MSVKEQNRIGIHMFKFGVECHLLRLIFLQGFERFLRARYLQYVITKSNTRTLEAASWMEIHLFHIKCIQWEMYNVGCSTHYGNCLWDA